MDTTLLLTALAALAVGLVVGYLLTRTLHPQEKQRKEMEDQLAKVQQAQKDYQHKVTEHFAETSTLVNALTESYRDLHEHLASSAMRLTSPEISRQLIEAGYGRIGEKTGNAALAHTVSADMPAPPKDYAPKVPGGVLSEDYGLDDTDDLPPRARESRDTTKRGKQGAHDTSTPTGPLDAAAENDANDDPTLKVS